MEACGVGLSEKKVVVSYALSKCTIANEMGDFDKYNQLNFSEFCEFIARAAEQYYPDTMKFDKKIEKLLIRLLAANDFDFYPPNLEEQLDSESDYDDDWVDDIT